MERVRRHIPVLFHTHRAPVSEADRALIAPAGDAHGPAFLLPPINPIRKTVVGDDVVELSGRLVVPGTPGCAAIYRDCRALIHAEEDVIWVLWIDPDAMVIVATGRTLDSQEGFASVRRSIRGCIRNVDFVLILRID